VADVPRMLQPVHPHEPSRSASYPDSLAWRVALRSEDERDQHFG
jgi:hypothetical protein